MWGRALALMVAASCWTCGGEVSTAGGTDAGTCPAVAACGGDIVGTWTLASECTTGHLTREANGCAITNTYSGAASSVSGTVVYNADGTFTAGQSSAIPQSIDVPAACLSMGDTCAQFGATLPVQAAQCLPAANGGCICTGSAESIFHQFGTYSTTGNTLIETVNGGTPVGLGYCVQGGTQLTVIGATAMGPIGWANNYTVLTR